MLDNFRLMRRVFGNRGLWFAALMRVFPNQQLSVKHRPRNCRHPLTLRLHTSDVATYSQVFNARQYAFGLKRHVPEVVVDAGANIGVASVYLANRHPRAQVFAIEPEKSNYELLRRNCLPYKNIVPINAALWNEHTMVDVKDAGIGHWGFQTFSEDNSHSAVVHRIGTVTLPGLMQMFNLAQIDILKVDIEGAEIELFSDASSWIDNVCCIAVELHDRMRVGCAKSFDLATKDFPYHATRGEVVIRSRLDISMTDDKVNASD